MRKIYLLLLLVSGFAFGQINLAGEAKYKLNITGYQDRDNNACGNIDGLIYIKATYQDGSRSDIFQGRKIYQAVDHEVSFTKNNPIVNLEFHKVVRWETTFGCDGGPNRNYDNIKINNTCFSSYQSDAGSELHELTVTSKPFIVINQPSEPQYLGDTEVLKIVLPDNLASNYYNWKFRVGTGPEKVIPSAFNNTPILNIKGEDFLSDADYGKIIYVWVNMNCSAGSELAKGHAHREAYYKVKECISNCRPSFPITNYAKCIGNCARNYTTYYNEAYTADLEKEYQSLNSNNISFTYLKASPKVVSTFPINVSCYDLESKDGSVKLEFDKLVLPREELNYTLINLDTGTPIDINGTVLMGANKVMTRNNLTRGKYEFQLLGFYDGFNTKVPLDVKTYFTIGSPTPVDFSLTKTDVRCNGDQDGTITISASGGTGKGYEYSIENGSWVPFLNKESTTETITGLHPLLSKDLDITYNIRVKDKNGCIAKIQTEIEGKIALGAELSKPITISQPATPISLTNDPIFKTLPTFHGAENGNITASFTGGTPINKNSYSYIWTSANYTTAVLASKTETQFGNDIYAITLKNVTAGTYNLTVTDANGCILNPVSQPKLAIILNEPDPIEIKLAITTPISCNTDNFDPITGDALKLADGTITATVKKGVPFSGTENNGLPYTYIWSKYNDVQSEWVVLTDITGPIATGLSKGSYSLNVKDKNGITRGTYNTIGLIEAIPAILPIDEPSPLGLTIVPTPISCFKGTNGSAIANVTGGTDGYFYNWDNNAKTQSISGLDANDGKKYWITIKDSKGCSANGGIVIAQPPSPISLEYTTVDNPKFSGATNGKLVVNVSGGTIKVDNSYGYVWKNSKGDILVATPVYNPATQIYTITLENLPADDYYLTVWDKNYNASIPAQIVNCSIIDSKKTLEQPKPLVVTLEVKQTISCNAKNSFGKEVDNAPADGQRDQSQDGILVAHVTGGVSLLANENSGLPYYFYWKKQVGNSWTALSNITGETASNLSHGNYALNIKDRNGIMLGTYVNNVLTQEIDVTQLMQEPPKLEVTITKGEVFCNKGNDGWATAHVTGGTPQYEYKWSNEVEINKNTVLKAGEYWVFITDARGCTTQESVTISEPPTPLAIKYKEVLNPSFYKATNGKIVVEVTGGTISSDNSYWFEWKNSKGIVQTTTTTSYSNDVYTISLNGVGEEIYSLTVRDANYDLATNKTGCTMINSSQSLEDPDPLQVTFELVRTISCNVSNEFGNETDANPLDNQRDESQDGLLIAHVKGGIQLQADKNNGLPYFYTWKKQQKDGSWILWNDQDETAENISDGTYALKIEDANGIKLGTYVNNILVEEKDVTQYMPEPEKLKLSFTKFDVGCTTGNDGWAKANVTGGTAPYTYQWTNEATTDKIENLTTNNYFVIVTDAKGCSVQGSIFVGDPKGIFTTETIKNPTCYKGNDASIQLNITGGNLPYSYSWNTGATTKDLNSLEAGNYEVAIKCPDCCVYKKKFVLKDPEPVIVNIGPDRTLCNDQNLDLDAAIADLKAQYSWTSTNGFASNEAKVGLTKAGTYHVKVTSALGCIGEDEIVIKNSNAVISSEFLLSSQAYLDEEVILINTSNPFGESTNWVLPKGVKVVEQKEKYITLKFDATGVYSIGLEQTQGECYAVYSKNITVEQRSGLPNTGTMSQFIVDFIVTPNPSNGNFKAHITLENNSAVNLRLFSTTGQNTMIQKNESGKKKYEIDFETTLESGMYVLVLETGQQTLVKKIIIY